MKIFFLLPVVIFFFSCSNSADQPGSADTVSMIHADSLRHHISILASDSFMGRKPFTGGETKTVAYLESAFKNLGLEPGNGNSFLQEVPMVNIASDPDSIMKVTAPGGSLTLKGFEDYVIWTEKTDRKIDINQAEVVFAGYGVVAPEYNWNDYAGLDVKNKVVLVLVNDPGFGSDASLFKGDTMTYYGRWTYKFEEAARQGAKGCLIIHNTKAASYPFSVVQNNWKGSRLLLDERGKQTQYCDFVGWVSEETGKRLIRAGGKDTALVKAANQKGFQPVPLGIQLSTSISTTSTYNKSHNVLAKMTGTEIPDEYIIYTAHWDHLGIGKPDDRGDSIYNGALDNASGTAALIELARAFKSGPQKPERSIIFLAVTAEEQGLWGSAWYAENPVYPLSKTLANINMDVLNWIGATHDVVVVGKGQSQLEDYLIDAAKKQNRRVEFDSKPAAGTYYRSDHFNFAKKGVPALYIKSGTDLQHGGSVSGRKTMDEYTEKHYHRPSDEYHVGWDMRGAVKDLELLYEVGLALANSAKWPEWKNGSEFKAIRDQQLQAR